MPVDLSDIGEPYPYPAHGPRLLPWLGIWFACCAVGVPLILLMWPSSEPASGAAFWGAVIGGPLAVFLGLLFDALAPLIPSRAATRAARRCDGGHFAET